ncbi:6478_t:CDS:2 [Entrophospora sp. SA101]|nr:16926_t:CDS:2 [Entrophospora sp. SA101]CAJ0824197.1 19837_t:CDS:2 [Entrophospora sp. SA101]CAJ0824216.1 19847_t:CDS:2 [Entrophospora sp. SA101]CAJ0844491.1 6478_t:CDS:2 [Entrophospora sp. SA101]
MAKLHSYYVAGGIEKFNYSEENMEDNLKKWKKVEEEEVAVEEPRENNIVDEEEIIEKYINIDNQES